MSTAMDVDVPNSTVAKSDKKPRFEVKKVGSYSSPILIIVERCCTLGMGYVDAMAQRTQLISDIVVDNCAICRNHIMDLCS